MLRKDWNIHQNALSMGIGVGIILSALQVLAFALNYTINPLHTWGLAALLIFLIRYTLPKVRELENGYLSYGQALLYGTILSLVSAVVLGITNFAYIEFIDPHYLEVIKEQTELTLYKSQQFTDAEIEEFMAMFDEGTTSGSHSSGQAFFYFILGFLGSLIISYFVKNPKPMFEE